jgi:hypothetical protein
MEKGLTNIKPQIQVVLSNFIPSIQILSLKPLVALHCLGAVNLHVSLEYLPPGRMLSYTDVVVFNRNHAPAHQAWLDRLSQHGIPYIYDLDDNFYEIPPENAFSKYVGKTELATMTRYLSHADLVRVYSQPLFERVSQFNHHVELVIPPLDWSLIETNQRVTKDDKVSIVYATSRTDGDELANLFIPAVKRLLETRSDKMEMHFWGYMIPDVQGYSNVFFQPFKLNYDRYLNELFCSGFDIGLAPLHDDLFHNSKNNTKLRENGACHIVGIYSAGELYGAFVEDSETGMLVANMDQVWYDALVKLVDGAALREKIKEQADDYVRQHHSQEEFQQSWMRQIEMVIERGVEPDLISYSTDGRSCINKDSQDRMIRDSIGSMLSWVIAKIGRVFIHLKRLGLVPANKIIVHYLDMLWMLLRIRTLLRIYRRKG